MIRSAYRCRRCEIRAYVEPAPGGTAYSVLGEEKIPPLTVHAQNVEGSDMIWTGKINIAFQAVFFSFFSRQSGDEKHVQKYATAFMLVSCPQNRGCCQRRASKHAKAVSRQESPPTRARRQNQRLREIGTPQRRNMDTADIARLQVAHRNG